VTLFSRYFGQKAVDNKQQTLSQPIPSAKSSRHYLWLLLSRKSSNKIKKSTKAQKKKKKKQK